MSDHTGVMDAASVPENQRRKADVLALSALLTTTMTNMTNVVKTIRNNKPEM